MTSKAGDRWLRRLAWAVTLGCLAMLAGTVSAVFVPGLRAALGFEAPQRTAYLVGQQVDTPPATYENSSHTLILFARASCRACQDAKPLLADVARQIGGTDRVAMSVVMPAGNDVSALGYVTALGLSPAQYFPMRLRELRVRVVPTAVLVDRTGAILAVAEGAGEQLTALTTVAVARANGY